VMTPKKTKLSETEIEESTNKVFVLYTFIKDKSSFNVQYRNNLARRLLQSETYGTEAERKLLTKLKRVGGADDFSKAVKMLNEYDARVSHTELFAQFLESKGLKKQNVEPLICSTAWPMTVRPHSFQLSRNMETIFNYFNEFYIRSDKKKTVSLLSQYGRGELAFYTGSREFLLAGVTEFQLVLLPMIDGKGVTIQHLVDESHLQIEEVKFQLSFLIKHKLLLIKNGEGEKETKPEDPETWLSTSVVTVNTGFKHASSKIMLQAVKTSMDVGSKGSTEGVTITEEEAKQIFKDYVVRTELCIVRVMKTRKIAKNVDVFTEVVKQLSKYFTVNKNIFKSACEGLVDQHVIKRRPQNEMEYLA